MYQIESSIGSFIVRHKYDELVIKEVIEEDQYRRWGDITIKSCDIVVDLGAHIGSFTRLALNEGARVYAYEPCPESFDLLIRNVELAKTVGQGTLHRKAVTSHGNSVILLTDTTRPELNTLVSQEDEHTISVDSVTLDEIILQYGEPNIDLLKLDVEMAEYEILYNTKYLSRIKQITLEWHGGATKMSKLIIYLEQKGFKTVWLGGNGSWGHLQLVKI